MFTGLQGQKIMYPILFMGKVCRKNPGFDKDKICNVWADSVWLCIFNFPLCTSKGIKDPFENKNNGPCLKKLGHPVFFFFLFFSLLLSFFRLIPWSIEAPCVHLSARVSKTWTGRRFASSLPWEIGKAPVASVNRQTFCLEVLLAFYVNQGVSASFSPLFSYLQYSFLISL